MKGDIVKAKTVDRVPEFYGPCKVLIALLSQLPAHTVVWTPSQVAIKINVQTPLGGGVVVELSHRQGITGLIDKLWSLNPEAPVSFPALLGEATVWEKEVTNE